MLISMLFPEKILLQPWKPIISEGFYSHNEILHGSLAYRAVNHGGMEAPKPGKGGGVVTYPVTFVVVSHHTH